MDDQPRPGGPPLTASAAREELRRKLQAMANQDESPAEAAIARRKLRELEREIGPDPRPFTERYRVASTDTVRRAPVQQPARTVLTVSAPTRLLYWVGAILLAFAVIGGAVTVVALSSQGGPLLAQGQTAPPPTPRPSPSPSPGLPDDPGTLDRFVAFLRDPHRTFRVDATTTVTGAGRDATITLTGSVAATRWSGEATVAKPATAPVSGRTLRIDDRWWYRLGGGWKTGYLPVADVPDVDPFATMAGLGDLVYLGPELHGGSWTQHVATRQGWMALWTAVNATGSWAVDSARMEFWLGPDDRPIDAVYTSETGTVATALRQSFTTTTTYRFSHIGEKVTITSP